MAIDPVTGAIVGAAAKEVAQQILDSNRCPACNKVRWLTTGLCRCGKTLCGSCFKEFQRTKVCPCKVGK